MAPSDTPPLAKPWRLGAAHRAGRTVIGRSTTQSPVPDGRRGSTGAGPNTQPRQYYRHAR